MQLTDVGRAGVARRVLRDRSRSAGRARGRPVRASPPVRDREARSHPRRRSRRAGAGRGARRVDVRGDRGRAGTPGAGHRSGVRDHRPHLDQLHATPRRGHRDRQVHARARRTSPLRSGLAPRSRVLDPARSTSHSLNRPATTTAASCSSVPTAICTSRWATAAAGNDVHRTAQDPQQLLGKILRLDVHVPDVASATAEQRADAERGYRIPPDNPFVDGIPVAARPEIWAFGLRNPWRVTLDDPALGGSGALLIGDVGQGAREEIDYQPAGEGGHNYGWPMREGTLTNAGIARRCRGCLPAADRSGARVSAQRGHFSDWWVRLPWPPARRRVSWGATSSATSSTVCAVSAWCRVSPTGRSASGPCLRPTTCANTRAKSGACQAAWSRSTPTRRASCTW